MRDEDQPGPTDPFLWNFSTDYLSVTFFIFFYFSVCAKEKEKSCNLILQLHSHIYQCKSLHVTPEGGKRCVFVCLCVRLCAEPFPLS